MGIVRKAISLIITENRFPVKNQEKMWDCKPGSVLRLQNNAVGAAVIYLGNQLPDFSSSPPGVTIGSDSLTPA